VVGTDRDILFLWGGRSPRGGTEDVIGDHAADDSPEGAQAATRTILDDLSALENHLHSIQRTGSTDPPATIASAKELLESICKLILDRRGVS
jgi:hypothetical protein